MESKSYQQLIKYDLSHFRTTPYLASPKTPIHRWFLINESSSLEQVARLLEEARALEYNLIIDPFCGSGTVGLQCALMDLNFLGLDKLAICVTGTRAKLAFKEMSIQQFDIFKKLIKFSLANLLMYSGDTELSIVILKEIISFIQKSILELVPPPAVYMFLSCLYSTAIKQAYLSSSSINDFFKSFLSRLWAIGKDLSSKSSIDIESKQVVYWGDSTLVSWSKILITEGFVFPAKALILTSPTHIASSRDTSKIFAMCNSAAVLALKYLGYNFIASKRLPTITRVDNIVKYAPARSHPYLIQLARVLHSFDKVSTPGSQIIIECENAENGNTVIEVDLLICAIAQKLGYSVEQIRVTHFVERPGKITSLPTSLRGSLIYLTK